jgi:phenylacetate-CoA ligase
MPSVSREELLAFQWQKLKSILSWACETVPYYRALFTKSGIHPQDIRSVADMAAIPITSSQDYRTRPLSEMLARGVNPDRLVCRPTSGATGKPFIIRRTAMEDHLLNQFRIRVRHALGIRPGDRTAAVHLSSGAHSRENLAGRIRQFLGLYRLYPLNCLASPDEILDQLSAIQPDTITGYPSVLAQVARRLLEQPRSSIKPRLITTGGEMLGPYRRSVIERGFRCPVFDVYGAHEFNLVAWQCPHTGEHHLCEDNIVVEILKDGRPAEPGESGEIVATGLHSYSMPFIRYKLGDIVTRGDDTCRCGAPFATLRSVEGRRHDYFRMPDGTSFHPDRIVVPIMEAEAPCFDRWRLLQLKPDQIVLQIQPFRPMTEEQLARLNSIARQQLPEAVRFSVEVVEHLEPEPGGKFRFCRSFVEAPANSDNTQA